VSVSRSPLGYGQKTIVIHGERGVETMHRQIVAGLKAIESDVVFMCEHDVLYHPSHFEFTPSRQDVFYYNTNVWKLRYDDGHAVWTDDLQQVSGLCAWREMLLEYYSKRLVKLWVDGWDRHYEPGPKTGNYRTENWQSPHCNLDIRHGRNQTRSKWKPSEFRNQRYAKGWRETDDILPGWGKTGREIVEDIRCN
jgi:hypothetical protein